MAWAIKCVHSSTFAYQSTGQGGLIYLLVESLDSSGFLSVDENVPSGFDKASGMPHVRMATNLGQYNECVFDPPHGEKFSHRLSRIRAHFLSVFSHKGLCAPLKLILSSLLSNWQ